MESEVSMTNETKCKILEEAKQVTSSKEAATDFKIGWYFNEIR
jgi:hypothetical protein